jgi:uncharacterized membrane protein YdbT with pleckstrin-like domain
MPFDRGNLHGTEEIVLDLHPHWIMLVKAIASIVVTTAVGGWLLWWSRSNDADGFLEQAALVVALVLLISSLVWFAQRMLAWYSTNFVVTTDRCIYRSGIIAKQGIEIPLDRINTVFFDQGPLERIVRAGDLRIESAGELGIQHFEDVRDPVRVQQVLFHEMENNENRKFDRVRGGHQPMSVADEIAKLAALRDQGHLTSTEFEAQKARLLQQPPA